MPYKVSVGVEALWIQCNFLFTLQPVSSNPATYADKQRSMTLAEEQRALAGKLGTKLSRWEVVCMLLESPNS